MSAPKKVACPTCGTLTEYSTCNPWRPFCSERCKLIDLGQWANENYRIPENEQPVSSHD
ncbi:MAG: DNA gyrase inhibitor YacG [Methylophilaceae bacterium]|nr:DNA gyrase inhibitor YacG [Methylophilaceae bacterium]